MSNLVAFAPYNAREALSNGRTFDYEETLQLSEGDKVWSNRSETMRTIIEDKVGTHDFLLTPCSEDTFRHFYPESLSTAAASATWLRHLHPTGSKPTKFLVRSTFS